MTAERLIRLMQHPEQLETIPYEELKTLVLAYPYAHHLRQLLLFKSRQINHHESERNLAAAAAHCIDRRLLYQRVVPVPIQQTIEFLELKPIETVLRNLEAINPVERVENFKQEVPLNIPEPAPPIKTFDNGPVSPVIATEEPAVSPLATAETIPVPPPPTAIIPDFKQWVSQFNLLPIRPAGTAPKTVSPAPIPSREKTIAQQLAEKSVSENKEVTSETLARILAKQGHREKAISMYERLIVANPEKSTIFAAAIEELKK